MKYECKCGYQTDDRHGWAGHFNGQKHKEWAAESTEAATVHYPTAAEIVDALITKAEMAQLEAKAWKEKYHELEQEYKKVIEEKNRILKTHNESIIQNRIGKIIE